MNPVRPLITALPLLLIVNGCQRAPKPAPQTELPAVAVQTAPVETVRVADLQEVVGTVRAKRSANVSAKVMAEVQNVLVQPGASVARGAVLVELDDRELRAEFDRAKADYQRFQALLEKSVVTRAEFEAVQSRFRIAEANLSHAKLMAPFDGVVAQKMVEVGDLATPGRPLFVIEQPGQFRLEANVPERFAGALKLGQELDVVIDALNGRCRGAVSEMIPTADPASRSFQIKIELPGELPLKSGLFGRALVPVGERQTLQVPASALRQRGQLQFVYVVENNRAQMRLVRPGKPAVTDKVEILSGLQAGEPVVTTTAAPLVDAQPVQQ